MKLRSAILFCALGYLPVTAFALPEVIDNSAYPASAAPANSVIAATPSSSTNTLLEITARMEQLQADVQQLTGRVEEQANLIAELKKRQSTMYSDFDDRIQRVEGKSESSPPTTQESSTPPPVAAEPEPEPSVEQKPRPIDADIGSPKPPAAPVADKPVAQPKVKMPTVSEAENQEYQQAYIALRNGHTDQAINDLRAYVSKYPSGGLAGNAQYWLGEAYRVKQDNESARKAFSEVLEKYPNSPKLPDSLLKLGYVEMDFKNTDKAREYLTRVSTEFPDSPAAHLAVKKLLILNGGNQ